MRIKSLELNGFKSFVDKQVIQFQPGITAVVGPNGCGKSNIVDGIRWAMGEQSPQRLRGKGMEDVIFGGSEGRSPVGMAEVILTFDNSGGDGPPAFAAYSEVQIARRLYRSGESEYLINRTPCRLRDVHDFFRDTGIGTKGYTIVEQGRVAEIVSARAEDRRALIEEAAGIGKYKARRREAESKIRSTEQNLLRVTDVLGEIRRQINSIERQAKKAARYKRLRETLRVLDLSLAADDRQDLLEGIESAKRRHGACQDAVTGLETQLAERELGLQSKRIELAECERNLNQGTEGLLALRTAIKDCEGQIGFSRRERESLAETMASRGLELEKLGEQWTAQDAEAQATGDELRGVESAVESEQVVVARAEEVAREAEQALRTLESERESSNAEFVEILTGIARNEDRYATVEDRRASIDARMRNADEGLEVGQSEAHRADREQRDLEEGLRNLLAERDRVMGLLRSALEAHEKAGVRARQSAEALQRARENRETRRARLASLKEWIEGRDDVGEGARYLLDQDESARRRFGVRGLLRDAFEVDAESERAVEAVLADRVDALVVNGLEGAVSALDALREAQAGRATFVTSTAADPEPAGFAPLGRPLLEHVRPRPGFENLAHTMLSGVNLVDSLAEVLEVYGRGRIPATFVTHQGDVLTPEGVVRGGRDVAAGSLSRLREVRDLESEVAQLEQEVSTLAREHAEIESALARAGDELENLRNRHHTAALAVANHEKDLERSRERVKVLGEAHESRVEQRSEMLAEIEARGEERERLAKFLEDAREERASRQRDLDSLGLRIGSAARELTRLETVATERRVEHAGRADNRDRLRVAFERATSAAGESREWIARREQEIENAKTRREELADVISRAEETLESRLREEEVSRAGMDQKREAYEGVSTAATEIEEAAHELRSEITRERDLVGQSELAVRESELRLAHLDDSIREKWDIELAHWTPPAVEPEPEVIAAPSVPPGLDEPVVTAEGEAGEAEEEPPADAAREARINSELARRPAPERRELLEGVRKTLQALGEVNLGAIEEHEELAERQRFLAEQKADLDGTLASLQDAIQRINRTSRRRFRETFEAVSKRFSENFPRLFRGGKASLSLTESEDVLEAGIEIMAMPPGKRLQNVNLLSGGEKTLTAIALLVAVFQVRPSPFFLLDEVDAALDDANVGRFNEIVTELAADSQFVLITHNKRTIEVADVLYGITMERKGVSRLVSVALG